MLFDANNQLVDAGWQRVTTDAGFLPGQENPAVRPHVRLKFDHPIKVTQAGSIYIWVSNESEDVKVWFDDLKVEHSTSLVVQATDYGTWGEVLRERKSEDRDYKFEYQGQFAERDEQTGWSHFELREYDPAIGRWMQFDPKRQFYSPYVGMGNNPISGVDFDGGEVYDDYVFDQNGKYVRTDVNDLPDRLVIENSATGSKNFYEFNDPVTDVAAILYNIKSFGDEFKNIKFIYTIDDARMGEMMKESGIEPMSAVGRMLFTAKESHAGKMDFSAYHLPIDLAKAGEGSTWDVSDLFADKGPIFIFSNQSRAYNYLDAGNWLWGNAVHRLGGSQMNAIKWSKMFNPRDSDADQYAIQEGYFYSAGFREPRK